MGLQHFINVKHSQLRAHAHRGTGITHKIAQVITSEPPRSGHWHTIEKRWLLSHPTCESCGTKEHLQVHHKLPFKHKPALELQDGTGIFPATGKAGDFSNLITGCMSDLECHLKLFHGDSFQFYNPDVEKDAARVFANPLLRPQLEAEAKAKRLKS